MKNALKKVALFLLEPIKLGGNRNISEKLSRFFNSNKYFLYSVAFIVTALIFVLCYL